MKKTLLFGVFSIVIAKLAYELGAKRIYDDRHEYYYRGYNLGKSVGALNEKHREEESE